MIASNKFVRAGFAVLVIVGSTATLPLRPAQADSSNGYTMTSIQLVTNPTTGDRKKVCQWQYDNGATTTTSSAVLLWGNHTNRGNRGHQPH